MTDLISQAQLDALINEFESDGSYVPWVTPVATLYADYQAWMESKGRSAVDVENFVFDLVRRQSCAPCRLPDGSLGVVGVKLKRDFN